MNMAKLLSKNLFLSVILEKFPNNRLQRYAVFPFFSQAIEKIQNLSHDELEEYRKNKLEDIVRYGINYVPYWKSIFLQNPSWFKNSFFRPLKEKNIFMDRTVAKKLHDFIANRSSVPFYELTSSGSTGIPIKFHIDKNLFARRAVEIAYVTKLIADRNNPVILRLSFKDMPWSVYQGDYVDPFTINKDSMRKILEKTKPEFLYGTVSHILLYADFFKNFLLKNKFQAILTRSEELSGQTRKYLETIFDAKVYSIYASREFGPIGQECIYQNGFHVNDDQLFLEIINSRGEDVRSGEVGEIFITAFFNKSMPFIRYQIGDLGAFMDGSCRCGLKTRKIKVVGRTADLLFLPNGKKFPLIQLYPAIGPIKFIKRFQFVQYSTHKIGVRLILLDNYPRNILDDIKKRIYSLLEMKSSEIEVVTKKVSSISLLPNGKMKLFDSYIH